MRTIVVGGGLTGLAAAYEFERQSVSAVLVEATSRLGGKVATAHADGFVLDEGPDSFLTGRSAALDLCRELGIADELIAPAAGLTTAIWSRGRLSPLPEGLGLAGPTRLRPFVSTPLLRPHEKLRAGFDLAIPRSRGDRDVAVGAFLRRRFGGGVVEKVVGPLVEAVYRCPVDELSLRATFPHLADLERRHRSLLLGSRAAGRANAAAAPSLVTLRSGMGTLAARLAAVLSRTEVRLGVRARQLERAGDGYRLRLEDGTVLEAASVLVTTPPGPASGLLSGLLPDAAGILRTLPSASTAVVSLAFRRSDLPRTLGQGFLAANAERLRVRAGTWSSEKWEGRAPRGTGLLRAFVAPEVATADASLIDVVREDLDRMGIGAVPILARVRRLTGAMPMYRVGHLDRVAALERALSAEEGRIALAGAFYRGSGVSDCIRQGRDAARLLSTSIH